MENYMEKYMAPEVEWVTLKMEDIILASGDGGLGIERPDETPILPGVQVVCGLCGIVPQNKEKSESARTFLYSRAPIDAHFQWVQIPNLPGSGNDIAESKVVLQANGAE